jgi:hypothetical protein
MLAIDKEGARREVAVIKEKLANPGKKGECIAEIKKLIAMKQSHIWRVDSMSPCCGSICGLVPLFEAEVGILQSALNALERGNNNRASALLEDYLAFLEKNYEDEHSNYW